VYIVSKPVGENGAVIGVDMTGEQLEIARKHLGSQAARFGYRKANVDFRQGYIENLQELGLADNSVDVVISNCVINLSPDKRAVFGEIFRVLKPGGELYFSDIFSSRRVPEQCKDDPLLHGECLAGAMYIEDFRRLPRAVGCPDYRVVAGSPVTIDNRGSEGKIGMVGFSAMTIRAFKLDILKISAKTTARSRSITAVRRGTPITSIWTTATGFLPASPCWSAAIPHRCPKTHAFPGTSKSPATERCITGPSAAPRHLSRRMTRTATAAAPAVRDSFTVWTKGR
jgi:hypothetical protein